MKNRTNGFMLFLLCIIIERVKSLNDSQTTINWKPLKPLLFNKDVILKCYIKDCCPEGTQWTGGKTNALLTLGRVSNNKAKYKESWGVDASYLTIKNFGIDDGDSLYTCFHGFLKYSRNLTIKENDFALMPSEKTLKKNFTVINGYLNANVEFLEVYPKPVCNGSFQKLDITEHITSDFYSTTSLFFNGKLNISHRICQHKKCSGTIQIDCTIGMNEFKVFEAIADIQLKTIYTTTDNMVILGITALATIIITVILTVFVIQLRSVHQRRKNKDQREPIKEENILKDKYTTDESTLNKKKEDPEYVECVELLCKT
ncbi:uncharacterized protein LOC134685029 isoform X2 [Mytilus trossulus]|uniref:uncharacterized protein LOC134685029 isoform X2 n=1 Tax=Mytilus trossulus TaxID=6551 RepID=UPI0030066979